MRRIVFALLVVVAVGLVVLAGGSNSTIAFTRGVPCTIHALGRDYQNGQACGNAPIDHSMDNVPVSPPCWTAHYIRHNVQIRQLDRIGLVVTLFHLYGVYRGRNVAPGSLTPTLLFLHTGTCYRPYSLEGGP